MSAETSPRNNKRKPWLIIAWVLIPVALIALIVYWFTHNYAQDAAEPIETVLANGGAVKMCGSGDPGRGPDNNTPHYEVLYEFSGTKDDAIKLITKAATMNGYTLTYQQSPYAYILWYSDETGKKSHYPGFSNGNVRIGFILYGDGEKKLHCGQQPLRSDATHTAISLGVSLPSAK